jgi:hypothetical protein
MISRYQKIQRIIAKKPARNSVKDIATDLEEYPNKLAANLMKTRGIVRRLERKKQIY